MSVQRCLIMFLFKNTSNQCLVNLRKRSSNQKYRIILKKRRQCGVEGHDTTEEGADVARGNARVRRWCAASAPHKGTYNNGAGIQKHFPSYSATCGYLRMCVVEYSNDMSPVHQPFLCAEPRRAAKAPRDHTIRGAGIQQHFTSYPATCEHFKFLRKCHRKSRPPYTSFTG